MSSLKFAQRAKTIKNKVQINIKQSYEELQKQILILKSSLIEEKNLVCFYQKLLDKNKDNLNISNHSNLDNQDKSADNTSNSNIKILFDNSTILNNKKEPSLITNANTNKTLSKDSTDELDNSINTLSNCKEHNEKINILNLEILNLKQELKHKDDIIKELTQTNNSNSELKQIKQLLQKASEEVKYNRSEQNSDLNKLEPILSNIENSINSSCERFLKLFDKTMNYLFIKTNQQKSSLQEAKNEDPNTMLYNNDFTDVYIK